MRGSSELRSILRRIDGRGYKAYKDIRGDYDFGQYILCIDHVQGDPFASPSRVRVKVSQRVALFPKDTYRNRSREVALRDFLTRCFSRAASRIAEGRRGSGKSGAIYIDGPGQEMLERTSVFVSEDCVEARFYVGLPAAGRRVLGREAEEMFFDEIPRIVRDSLIFRNLDSASLYRHIEVSEDQDYIRGKLDELGLVAFIANGSILPRASGVDDRPLAKGRVIPFVSPPSLEVTLELPNSGTVRGMGIPRGVTLIAGGGYHGKSTVLRAIERGIYNHIPGDGRELVVSDYGSVKIRAEDGRRIEKVNISPFINHLPFGQNTNAFSTDDASGSTSQAANIIEALEVGARVLLIDEDTSATNFMIRDHRMQELVSKDKEPITPFIDKVRQLYSEMGVSTVIVIGGSGDYFDVADTVIVMEDYLPRDATEEAKLIARKYRAERRPEGGESFGGVSDRIPIAESIDPSKGKRDVKITAKGVKTLLFGRNEIDLTAVEQLVDPSQIRAIGDAIVYAKSNYMDGRRTLREIMDLVMGDIEREGLDILSPYPAGDYALPRRFEIAAAINRLRTVRMRAG